MLDELKPDTLIRAYCAGIFPMADEKGDLGWFSPDPRAVIELDTFKVPRSLRQRVRRGGYEIRINTCFGRVIRRCADRDEGTWISADIIEAYCNLHRLGYAHSVETYYDDQLAGGLYGVSVGGAYFGESMFTARAAGPTAGARAAGATGSAGGPTRCAGAGSDGSKLALVALVERMKQRGLTLLDIQFMTPHLARFGAREIPRADYLSRLESALRADVGFCD